MVLQLCRAHKHGCATWDKPGCQCCASQDCLLCGCQVAPRHFHRGASTECCLVPHPGRMSQQCCPQLGPNNAAHPCKPAQPMLHPRVTILCGPTPQPAQPSRGQPLWLLLLLLRAGLGQEGEHIIQHKEARVLSGQEEALHKALVRLALQSSSNRPQHSQIWASRTHLRADMHTGSAAHSIAQQVNAGQGPLMYSNSSWLQRLNSQAKGCWWGVAAAVRALCSSTPQF